jgi:hypothetical protein
MHHSFFKIYLLLQIANEASETDLIRQLRAGVYNGFLPETQQDLRQMIRELTVKRPYIPGPFLNGFLGVKLRLLKEHKKCILEDNLSKFDLFVL